MSIDNRIEKLIEITIYLQNKGETIAELIKVFSVSGSKLSTNLQIIKNAGIIINENKENYYIEKTDNKAFSDVLCFSKEAAHILCGAIDKIETDQNYKIQLKKKLHTLFASESIINGIISTCQDKVLHDLMTAIKDDKCCSIIYEDTEKTNKRFEFKVEPYDISARNKYLQCYDPLAGINAAFRISQIYEVNIHHEFRSHKNHYEPVSFDAFNTYTNTRQVQVKIMLDKAAKNAMVDFYPLTEKSIQPYKKNQFLYEDKVSDMEGIGRFLLGYLDSIRVLQPAYLEDFSIQWKNTATALKQEQKQINKISINN